MSTPDAGGAVGFDFETVIERRGTGAKKWSRYAPDVLPMWVADMDFAAAPAIIEALRRRLDHPVLGYGAARDELREAVVAAMADRYGWRVAAEEIVFLPGVEPGFNMALAALLPPGAGVVVQTPAYAPMLAAPSHWDLRRLDVALRDDGAGGFATDMPALEAALAEAGALLFCHPHNPTGKVFTRPELEAIAGACLRHGSWIISDEIHCDLLFDGRRHVPMASLAPEVAARTITLMSASKSFNLAGMKTAFAIVPDAGLRARFGAAQHGLVDSVNVMGLEATLAALTEGEPWRQALIATLQANRDWLVAAVPRQLPGVGMHRPEATFLAWLDCRALDLGGVAPQAFFLERARVGLSAGAEFGASWHGYVRLNFGCPRRTLEEGIARMAASLARR